jgi:hypothetical protein
MTGRRSALYRKRCHTGSPYGTDHKRFSSTRRSDGPIEGMSRTMFLPRRMGVLLLDIQLGCPCLPGLGKHGTRTEATALHFNRAWTDECPARTISTSASDLWTPRFENRNVSHPSSYFACKHSRASEQFSSRAGSHLKTRRVVPARYVHLILGTSRRGTIYSVPERSKKCGSNAPTRFPIKEANGCLRLRSFHSFAKATSPG